MLAARFDATAVARELERDAPLRVHRAIVGTAPLTCAPIVLARLRGREGSELHGELAPARVIGATRSFDDLQLATAVKHDILRRLADAPVGPRGRVVVRGRLGSGRHTLLATLAAAAGRTLAVIDAAALAPDRLADVLAAAQLAGALPCVDGLDRARDLRAVLDDHPGPLAIRLPWEADATAPPLPAGHVALELPPLTYAERIAAWNATAAAHGLAVADVAALADRFAVGPGGIELACATLAGRGLTPDDAAPALAAILRAQAEPVLRALATQIQPAPWSRVVVPADVHDSVRELIARIAHRRRATAWHHGGNDAERGVIALIHGAPGTGKTLVASTVAGELGLPLYRVEVARLAEPRAQLIALLDAADYAGAVIVLAEVDALLADRAALDALAVRLERCDGIVIITARAGAAVETALRRQLAFRFALLFPDEDAREQLWRLHVPRGAAIDLAQITQLGQRYALSGASIRAAATRAAFLALEEQTALGLDHLERAIRAEIRELTALSALAPAD